MTNSKTIHLVRILFIVLGIALTQAAFSQVCENYGIGTYTPTSKLVIKGCGADSTTSAFNVTDTNGTSLFYISDNKKLGINTTNPRTSLQVQSNASGGIYMNNTIGDPRIGYYINSVFTSRFMLGVDSSDAKKFKIGTTALDSSTRLTVDSIGNLGIGTSTPSSILDLESSATSDGIDINNTAADGDPRIAFQLSGTSVFTMGIDDSDGDKFKIGTTGVETDTLLTIDAEGDFGIGTSDPGNYKMVIVQDEAFPGYGFRFSNPTGSVRFRMSQTDTYVNFEKEIHNGALSFALDNILILDLNANANSTLRGNGGQATLDVRGSASFNGDFGDYNFNVGGDYDANLFHVDASADKIGISTLAPTVLLDLEEISSKSGHNGIDLNNTATDGDPRIAFQLSDSTIITMGVDDSDGDKFKIGTTALATNTRIAIDANGLVGIGTSSPSYQLQLSLDSAGKPSTSTWTITSDQRVKKDITPFTDGLSVVRDIMPVKYRYNGLGGTPSDNKVQIGIIAQQIDTVAPYCVRPIRQTLKGDEVLSFPGDVELIGQDTVYTLLGIDTIYTLNSIDTVLYDSQTEAYSLSNGQSFTLADEEKSSSDTIISSDIIPRYDAQVVDIYQGELKGFDPHALLFVLINTYKELSTTVEQLEGRVTALEKQ